MAYEFTKLSEVPTSDTVADEATVLVVQDGSVQQVTKDKVGGVTEIIYFTLSDSSLRTGNDWSTGSEAAKADVVTAYENGPVKIFYMYAGSLAGVGDVVGYRMYNDAEQPVWVNPKLKVIQDL